MPINRRISEPKEPTPQRADAHQTAWALWLLYNREFGGKKSRRFRISRANFRDMCNWTRLSESFITEVSAHLTDWGFDFIEMEDYFIVQKSSVFRNSRRVPRNLRQKAIEAAFAELDEIEDDQVDGDDDEDEMEEDEE